MAGGNRKTVFYVRLTGVVIFALSAFLCLPIVYAQSQSVILPPIPLSPGSKFGMRMHPIQHVMKLHGGQDYPTPVGTRVNYTGSLQSCYPNGSAGNMATVGNACGVKQVFMHLQSCNSSSGSVITGNTGGSTGAHLHYEIHINGTKVNPMKAFNKNLCDDAVRKELLDDAKQNGSGNGSGAAQTGNSDGTSTGSENNGNSGSSTSSNAPEPPPMETGSSYYVGPGETNPQTGEVNNGAGYYVVTDENGRTYTQMEIKSTPNNYSILPESATEFTQTVQTNNEMTGCATDTWKAMVNAAVLQTRREMIYNERYIAKPDSVLAYSCLTEAMKKVGENIGPLFSETKMWKNRQIDIMGKTVTVNVDMGENSLDGSIYNAANNPMISFIQSAFPHDVNGGLNDTASGGGMDEEGTSQDGLPCGTMAKVWQTVKCTNLTDDPPFRRFDQLINKEDDERKHPKNMKCNNTGITQGMIDLAKNKSVKFDKVKLYYDKLLPDGDTCAPAIKSGVTVYVQKGSGIITTETSYADGVCISPGCSYQNNGSGDGECKVKEPE